MVFDVHNAVYTEADPKIRYYLKLINSLEFVRTKYSCQGHFISKPEHVPIIFKIIINHEDTYDIIHGNVISQIKNPSIVLEFEDKLTCSNYLKVLTRLRTRLRIPLYIFWKRKLKNVKGESQIVLHKEDNSLVVSRIDDIHIGLTIVMFPKAKIPFRYKLLLNKEIQKARKYLFKTLVYDILSRFKEY